MKSTHTHRGNCQVCGRLQAIDNDSGSLAKHGYNVERGYFQGTCSGSHEKPLQIERTITDELIRSMGRQVVMNETSIKSLKTGKMHPTKIASYDDITLRRLRDNHYEDIMVLWTDANEYSREQGIKTAVWDLESHNKFLKAHAKSMGELADRLHGTPVLPVVDEVKAPKAEATVDIKNAKVDGTFGSKAARKNALDNINREYEKQTRKLQALYLAIPYDERMARPMTPDMTEKMEVYYTPMYPHQWKPKHSAAALKHFPLAAAIVAEIEILVRARQAVKDAP